MPEQRLGSLSQTGTGNLYGGGEIAVVLSEVAGAADSATRTYRARYHIVDANPALGSTATLVFAGAATKSYHAVPTGAVTERGGGPGVWVIGRDNKVSWRAVTLMRMDGERSTVQGLRSGTRIVALGAHLLQPGQAIRDVSRRATGGTAR